MTQQEVTNRLGINRARVSFLERRALWKLARALGKPFKKPRKGGK